MASIRIDINYRDDAAAGLNILQQRLRDTGREIQLFNRTRAQQERDHTAFLTAQYRQRVNERKRALREETQAADRARRQEERDAEAAQRQEERLRRYHQQLVIRSRRDESRAAERARREEVQAAEAAQRQEERLRRYHQQLVIRSRRDEAEAAERSARRQELAIRRIGQTYERFTRSIGRFATNVGAIGLFSGGFSRIGEGVRGIVDTGVLFDQITRSVTALTGSVVEARRQVELFRELALQPGLEFDQVSRAALQFQSAGHTIDETTQFLRFFGNEIALAGVASGDVLDRITLALTQISAGGVRGQEVRQLVDALPTIGQIFREAFGSIKSEEIAEAIGGLENVEEFYRRIFALRRPTADPDAVSVTLENYRNAILNLQDAIARSTLPQFNDILLNLTSIINDNRSQIAEFISNIGTAVTSSVSFLVDNAERLVSALRASLISGAAFTISRFASRATESIGGVINSLSQLRTTGINNFSGFINTLRQGSTGVAGAINLIGTSFTGVLGIIGAASAVFAGIQFFRALIDGASNARSEIEILNTSLDNTRRLLREVGDATVGIQNFSRNQIATGLESVVQQRRQAEGNLAELLGRLTDPQAQAELERLRVEQPLSRGFTREDRENSIRAIRERTVGEQQLRTLANERLRLIGAELSELRLFPSENSERIRQLETEQSVLQNNLEIREQAIQAERELRNQIGLTLSVRDQEQSETSTTPETPPPGLRDVDIRDPLDLRVLGVGLENFRQSIRRSVGDLRTDIEQPFISSLSALSDVVDPLAIASQVRQDIVPVNIIDEDAANTSIQNIANRFEQEIDEFAERLRIDELLSPDRIRRSTREVTPGGAISAEITEALDQHSDLRVRLRQRYDQIVADREEFQSRIENLTGGIVDALTGGIIDLVSIPSRLVEIRRDTTSELQGIERALAAELESIRNNAALSQEEQIRRITDAERNAASERIQIAQNAERARSEAYLGWARNALRAISQVIAAEAQSAIARSVVQRATPLIATALGDSPQVVQ